MPSKINSSKHMKKWGRMENTCKICETAKCRWDACDDCQKEAKEDPRVKAIRSHKLVGRDSLTSIDEATDDHELVIELNRAGANTSEKAIKWAIEDEGLRVENATNFRWGEDDDPQLKAYREWQEKVGK